MQKAAQAYFQTQVATTSQGDLLLLLYEGAIKFLKQAKIKIEEKDYAEKGILISKAMDVIAELDGSLNVNKGGDLAKNLHHLYFFCNTRLLKANLNLDIAIVDEVIKVLSGLQDAFKQIIKEGAQATPSPVSQTSTPRPFVPQNRLGNSGVNMLQGGLLRPQAGAAPQNNAPGAQPGKVRPPARPLPANGAAKAVQLSQKGLLEQTYVTPIQKASPSNTKGQQVPTTQVATSDGPVQQKTQTTGQARASAPTHAQISDQSNSAKPNQPKKKQVVPKQPPSKPDYEQSELSPKQPLNINKARMLAGYKKMASQT